MVQAKSIANRIGDGVFAAGGFLLSRYVGDNLPFQPDVNDGVKAVVGAGITTMTEGKVRYAGVGVMVDGIAGIVARRLG